MIRISQRKTNEPTKLPDGANTEHITQADRNGMT